MTIDGFCRKRTTWSLKESFLVKDRRKAAVLTSGGKGHDTVPRRRAVGG
jgi:hypothetical protein